jgi:hypothetical protein
LYEHSIFPQREIVLHCTYPNKTFSYDDFAQRLKSGELKYWIGKKQEPPKDFLNVQLQDFTSDTVIGRFAVYRRK